MQEEINGRERLTVHLSMCELGSQPSRGSAAGFWPANKTGSSCCVSSCWVLFLSPLTGCLAEGMMLLQSMHAFAAKKPKPSRRPVNVTTHTNEKELKAVCFIASLVA